MKIQLKILIALFTIVPITASANVDTKNGNGYKKQCQYIVYGNGNDSSFYSEVMAGISEDIRASLPVEDTTAFSKYTTRSIMQLKACKNALNHITSDGFENDYKVAVLKLISTK